MKLRIKEKYFANISTIIIVVRVVEEKPRITLSHPNYNKTLKFGENDLASFINKTIFVYLYAKICVREIAGKSSEKSQTTEKIFHFHRRSMKHQQQFIWKLLKLQNFFFALRRKTKISVSIFMKFLRLANTFIHLKLACKCF